MPPLNNRSEINFSDDKKIVVSKEAEYLMLAHQVHWFRKNKNAKFEWMEIGEEPIYELL